MLRFLVRAIALTLALLTTGHCLALGISNLANSEAGFAVVSGQVNQSFVAGNSDMALTSVSLNIVKDVAGTVTVSIYGNSSGAPGSLVSGGLLSGPADPNGLVTYVPTSPVRLLANTTYWVVMVVSGSGASYARRFTVDTAVTSDWTGASIGSLAPLIGHYGLLSVQGVVAPAVAIPTLSEWGLIILSALLAMGTFGVMRRRQI
jgi:hypothetical protein